MACLYIGVHFTYHFKWDEETVEYTDRACELLALMTEYNINNDGLDDVSEGTVLYVKCPKSDIKKIVHILEIHCFDDWDYMTYVDEDDFRITLKR
jgi:hypothetical protein